MMKKHVVFFLLLFLPLMATANPIDLQSAKKSSKDISEKENPL
jgi:hypothetical protein